MKNGNSYTYKLAGYIRIMSTPLEQKSSLEEIKKRFDKEDSPRPVTYQLDLLRKAGFRHTDLLHKNSCFAAFGATKIS
jgi:tRNA (cmo5U34)-methyltransferase